MAEIHDPKLAEELAKMETEYEELLPIEKHLIAWSVAIGVTLLALLVWLSHTYFEA